MRNCWVILVALTRRDHTGSRAIEWFTEVDPRRHTCMIDGSVYVVDDSSSSVMNENGKTNSQQQVVFGTRHDQPV